MKARSLHRRLAPAIVVPLLFTVVSGMAFRVGRIWFGLSADFGGWMMALHEGRYLGERLVPFYVLGVGLALLAMIGSGLSLLRRRRLRSWHAWLAPVLAAPLLVSAVTGISFRLGKAWFDIPTPAARWLLRLHQGSYLGKDLRVVVRATARPGRAGAAGHRAGDDEPVAAALRGPWGVRGRAGVKPCRLTPSYASNWTVVGQPTCRTQRKRAVRLVLKVLAERRLVVRRFPYAVYFREVGDEIVVLTIHGRQNLQR